MLATNRRPRFLRVLMISDVYFPRINGVSTSIETFRADLAAEGIQVRLIAPAYPERHDAPATWRVPSRRIPFDPEDRLMRWQPLRQTAHHLAAEGVDLIHVQTPFAAHYAGTRTARRHNVPVLATYHTHFEEYIAHYLPALPRPLLRAAARRIATGQCNDLDAVVVPSRAMHETLTGYGVTAPLHILPTGIPVQSFAGGRCADFRRRHDIPAERPVALFVGRVAHEKNIGFLIEAMAAGLPVYALAEMGTRDILAPQRGAIIAPDEPAAFGSGLAALLGNRYQLDVLAAEARDYSLEWAAPARARQLAGLYRSLVTSPA